MKTSILSSVILVLLTACSGVSINISFGQPSPTASASPTMTVLPTATPNLDATATSQAQASSTAQAQASLTARAATQVAASATSHAQSTATAVALAQQTASANATQQAFMAYLDATAASAKKAYGPADGVLQQERTNTVAWLDTNLFIRNFVADLTFSNPADPSVHAWDYGVAFRSPPSGRCSPEYRFRLNSDQTYVLTLISGTNPEAPTTCSQKIVTSGTARGLNISPTGSNVLRLVVQDKLAFALLNGAWLAAMDVSENNSQGTVWIGGGFQIDHMFPGLATRYKSFVISTLP